MTAPMGVMAPQANPYQPPAGDGAARSSGPGSGPSPRVYAWISIGIGLAVVAMGLSSGLELEALLDAWSGQPAPGADLPPPQQGMMAVVAEGLFDTDPRLRWLQRVWFVISRVMPPLLLLLGIVQLKSRRWLHAPTLLWTVAALALLAIAVALVVLVTSHRPGAAAAGSLALIVAGAPYPVVLLAAARQARRAARQSKEGVT